MKFPGRSALLGSSFQCLKGQITTRLTAFVFSSISFLAGSAPAQMAPHSPTALLESNPEDYAGRVPSQPRALTGSLSSSVAVCRVSGLSLITDDEALTFEKLWHSISLSGW